MSRALLIGVVSATFLAGLAAWILRPVGPVPCEALRTASDRDLCLYDEATGPDAPAGAELRSRLQRIGDPIVRSAAVVGWLDAHPEVTPQEGEPLCDLLVGTERMACQRRVHSPHLRR